MLLRQFSKFFIVGGVGFCVDAGILYLLLDYLGPYYSRAISFFIAVFSTWLLNRNFVFGKTPNSKRESAHYFAVQGLGFALNLSIYSLFIYYSLAPLIALVIASGIAMFWNFAGAKLLVFKEK